jgi:hypothetical protein
MLLNFLLSNQLRRKFKKSSESSLSNEKTKNSLSEKRGSIVKSIDKLASSIATDEASAVAVASSSSMMPMFMVMQMQQQSQQQMQFQQAFLQREVETQIKGVEAQVKGQGEAMMKVLHAIKKRDKKERKKKKKKRARKRKAIAEAGGEKVDVVSSSSSSSSSI